MACGCPNEESADIKAVGGLYLSKVTSGVSQFHNHERERRYK